MNRKKVIFWFVVLIMILQAAAIECPSVKHSLQPCPQVEVTGQVTGSDAPETGIAGIEVVFTGNGIHTGITDNEGYFSISTINSNSTYIITIEAEGYVNFETSLYIGEEDVDLGVIILIEYIFPPYNVTAIQDSMGITSEISWHSPEEEDLYCYILSIGLAGDEENYEYWDIVAEGIMDTVYIDQWWDTMETGIYKYAVRAVNPQNNISEPGFSNWLAKDMNATVELYFTTNFGEIAIGAEINLVSTEPDPDGNYPSYQGVTDEEGSLIIEDVWQSNYDLSAELWGYQPIEENIDINQNTVVYNGMFVTELPPPYDVTAIEMHNGSALIEWHSVPGGGDSFGYSLYRGLEIDQMNFEDWDLITTVYTDTIYVDESWTWLTEPGEYLYCVRKNYMGGVQSPPAFSNVLYYNVTAPVFLFVTCNSGDSADGAEVDLANYNGSYNYSAIIENGVAEWEDVFFGVYELTVSLPGYETYIEPDIWHTGCLTLEIELEEISAPPENLQFNQNTGFLTWEAPETGRHINHYIIYIENAQAGITTELMYDISAYLENEDFTAGVSAYYSSEQESEVIEIEIPGLAENAYEINPPLSSIVNNYPNPFNPETNISYEIKEPGLAEILILNIKGQKLRTLVSKNMQPGSYNIRWDGKDDNGIELPSNMYICKLITSRKSSMKKIILLK